MAGNELQITPELYDIFRSHARRARASLCRLKGLNLNPKPLTETLPNDDVTYVYDEWWCDICVISSLNPRPKPYALCPNPKTL